MRIFGVYYKFMDQDLFIDLINAIQNGGSIEAWLKSYGLKNTDLQEYIANTVGAETRLKSAITKRTDCLFETLLMWTTEAPNLDKNEVAAAKLGIDTLKWVLSVQNPEKYTNKMLTAGDEGGIFLLDTGIRRESDESEGDY